MKRLAFLSGAVAVLLVVAAACGSTTAPTVAPAAKPTVAQQPAGTQAPAAQPPGASGGTTTIMWGFWGSPEEVKTHEAVKAAFEASHPNIKIKVFHEDWNNYFDKVNTLWAGGDPNAIPDVLFLSPIQNYAAKGVLEDLTPWIQKTNYNTNDYFPTVLDSASWKGQIYGLPRDLPTEVIYYNKKLFDEAGVAYPKEGWTWDDFRAIAEKLTKKDASGRTSQYALGMEGGKWRLWVMQKGVTDFDDLVNPSKCQLTDPRAIEGVKWFADLMNSGLAVRSATLNQAGGDAAMFQNGQVAMIAQNASRIVVFNANPKIDYDLQVMPVPKDGRRASANQGAAWVMSKASNKKDAAWPFLSWLQSKDGGQKEYVKGGDVVPVLKSLADDPAFLKQKPDNRRAFLVEALAATPGRTAYFPEFNEINSKIISPQMDRIWAGEAKPEDVLPAICQQVDKALKDAGYPKK